jgi:hypothetical protein
VKGTEWTFEKLAVFDDDLDLLGFTSPRYETANMVVEFTCRKPDLFLCPNTFEPDGTSPDMKPAVCPDAKSSRPKRQRISNFGKPPIAEVGQISDEGHSRDSTPMISSLWEGLLAGTRWWCSISSIHRNHLVDALN